MQPIYGHYTVQPVLVSTRFTTRGFCWSKDLLPA